MPDATQRALLLWGWSDLVMGLSYFDSDLSEVTYLWIHTAWMSTGDTEQHFRCGVCSS